MNWLKNKVYSLLRWSERYTKTDMVYLATSGFWLNLSSISVSGFSFLLYLAFAHFLPKDIYGSYQYLLSVSVVVGAFTLTGMNGAVSRAIARGYEGSLRSSVYMQLRWGLLPLLGAWAAGAYYLFQGNSVLGWGLILIGLFVPFNNALNTYSTLPGNRKDFRGAFLFNFSTNLLYYPALIIAAYFSKSALILLAANLISQAIALIILYRISLRVYKPNDSVDPDTVPYGMHLTLMGFAVTFAQQFDSILAFHFLGAIPLAIYSFATGIPDRIGSLTKFLPIAAFPKMAVTDPAVLRRTIGIKMLWLLCASAVFAGIYIVFAHLFFSIFFPAYVDAVPYSMVYALIMIPAMGGIFTTALTANRSIRALYIFNFVSPVVQIISLVIGVIYWGLWGLIIARLGITSLQFLLSGWLFFMENSSAENATLPEIRTLK